MRRAAVGVMVLFGVLGCSMDDWRGGEGHFFDDCRAGGGAGGAAGGQMVDVHPVVEDAVPPLPVTGATLIALRDSPYVVAVDRNAPFVARIHVGLGEVARDPRADG